MIGDRVGGRNLCRLIMTVTHTSVTACIRKFIYLLHFDSAVSCINFKLKKGNDMTTVNFENVNKFINDCNELLREEHQFCDDIEEHLIGEILTKASGYEIICYELSPFTTKSNNPELLDLEIKYKNILDENGEVEGCESIDIIYS